jgi:putative membrane protein
MNYLLAHWTLDPFCLLACIVVGWHETGLVRLARRGGQQGRRDWRHTVLFYAGLAVLLLAVASPVGYWSDRYFFVHMIQHLLLMFAAPSLVVAGAPWQPLRAALPSRATAAGTAWSRPLRAALRFLLRPWVSVVAFNATMIAWHLPPLLDLAVRNQQAGIWLMHGSFFAAGVLFWLLFIPSPPLRITMAPAAQAMALLATNVVMWILAMSMGILTSTSWYPVYNHIPGVTLPAFADQQIGAGILWICGDFWAVPAMISVVRRFIAEDGSVGSALDRILHRGSARYTWADRG